MKRTRSINSSISKYISSLGHKDYTCISDAGLPIPSCVEKIDVSIERGIPNIFQVMDVINDEAIFEEIILAKEIMKIDSKIEEKILKIFGEIKITYVSHDDIKNINKENTKGIIRTGENKKYHNFILISGVKL